MSNDEPAGRWQVDRHIPLALITTIVIQSAVIVWWASRVDATQAAHSARIERLEERQDILRTAIPRIEAQLSEILRRLDREEGR